MRRISNTIKEHDIVLWVNITLLGTVFLLFLYYVMMANSVTAKSYKVQTLHDKLQTLAETNSLLVSKKLVLESQTALFEFARSSSLVKAGNILYIFENKNVAQR